MAMTIMLIPPVRKISILLAFGRFFDFRFFSLCVFFLVPGRSAAVFCGLAADGCLFWAACFAVGVFLLRTVWAVFFVVCGVFPVGFVFIILFCAGTRKAERCLPGSFIYFLFFYIFASCAITTCGMVLSGACWQTPPIL